MLLRCLQPDSYSTNDRFRECRKQKDTDKIVLQINLSALRHLCFSDISGGFFCKYICTIQNKFVILHREPAPGMSV